MLLRGRRAYPRFPTPAAAPPPHHHQNPLLQAVVFFSYWQSVALAIMARLGLIRSADWSTYDADDVAAGLQNFLICVEMFLAAVMHAHAFPPRVRARPAPPQPLPAPSLPANCGHAPIPPSKPCMCAALHVQCGPARPPLAPCPSACPQDYMDPSRPPPGFFRNVKVMFDVRDVVDDVSERLPGSCGLALPSFAPGAGPGARASGSSGRRLSCLACRRACFGLPPLNLPP